MCPSLLFFLVCSLSFLTCVSHALLNSINTTEWERTLGLTSRSFYSSRKGKSRPSCPSDPQDSYNYEKCFDICCQSKTASTTLESHKYLQSTFHTPYLGRKIIAINEVSLDSPWLKEGMVNSFSANISCTKCHRQLILESLLLRMQGNLAHW